MPTKAVQTEATATRPLQLHAGRPETLQTKLQAGAAATTLTVAPQAGSGVAAAAGGARFRRAPVGTSEDVDRRACSNSSIDWLPAEAREKAPLQSSTTVDPVRLTTYNPAS